MNYSAFYSNLIHKIYATTDIRETQTVQRVQTVLPQISMSWINAISDVPANDLLQTTLFLTSSRGHAVGPCPGSRGHICCNYWTVDLVLGCPIGCSYCIMMHYLNFQPITAYTDTSVLIRRVRQVALQNPQKRFRIGTGEVGDSLLFDPLLNLSASIITGLADLPNVWLELKTKTNFVDHLLSVEPKGNVVLGFSLNPDSIIHSEEGIAASLEQRLEAAHMAVKNGFFLAFHFDPILLLSDWQELYLSVIKKLKRFPSQKIQWISLGTFRYPPGLKEKMNNKHYLWDEFVQSKDGKFRYIQKKRIQAYRFMVKNIREIHDCPIYLCMESVSVWRYVFFNTPMKIKELRDIFLHVKQ